MNAKIIVSLLILITGCSTTPNDARFSFLINGNLQKKAKDYKEYEIKNTEILVKRKENYKKIDEFPCAKAIISELSSRCR